MGKRRKLTVNTYDLLTGMVRDRLDALEAMEGIEGVEGGEYQALENAQRELDEISPRL